LTYLLLIPSIHFTEYKYVCPISNVFKKVTFLR